MVRKTNESCNIKMQVEAMPCHIFLPNNPALILKGRALQDKAKAGIINQTKALWKSVKQLFYQANMPVVGSQAPGAGGQKCGEAGPGKWVPGRSTREPRGMRGRGAKTEEKGTGAGFRTFQPAPQLHWSPAEGNSCQQAVEGSLPAQPQFQISGWILCALTVGPQHSFLANGRLDFPGPTQEEA